MADKKWSKDVDLKEGALTKQGWPNIGAVIANVKAGTTPYATTIQRLSYLANITKDPATKTKARAAIVRMRREFGKDKK